MNVKVAHSYVATIEDHDGSVWCSKHGCEARLFYSKECLFSWKVDHW